MGANGKLTGTERTELRRIIKARFELLQKQLGVRQREIEIALQTKIREEYKAKLKHYREAVERNTQAQKKLEEELKALSLLAYDEGISISYSGQVTVAQEHTLIRERLQKIVGEKLEVGYRLSELELKILERLAVTGLDSIEAVEFLESIPELDQLLPSPKQLKLTK